MYKINVRKSKRDYDFYYFNDIEKVFELIELIEQDYSVKFKGKIQNGDITFMTCYNHNIEVIIIKCYPDLYTVSQVNKKIQEMK